MSWKDRAQAALDSAGLGPGEHAWFRFRDGDTYDCCVKCGTIRRADGLNKPCPGRVRISLRG